MSELEIGFRTAAFGFRREDVLEFIAQEANRRQEIETQLQHAREDAEQLRAEKEDADKAAKALLSEHDHILAERTEQNGKIETLKEEVRRAEDRTAAIQAELDQLRRENAALQKALDDTQMENTDLSSKCTEYDEARGRLAEIELCAYGRAEKIHQNAEQEACALIREAQETAEHLLETIAQTKETYWQALTNAEREHERTHANAVCALSHLDDIMNGLRERITEQIASEKEAVQDSKSDLDVTEDSELWAEESEQQAEESQQQIAQQEGVHESTQLTGGTGRERPTLAQVLGALHKGK